MHLEQYNNPLDRARYPYQRHLSEQGSVASGKVGKSYEKSVQATIINQNKIVYKTADVNFSGLSSSIKNVSVGVLVKTKYQNLVHTIKSSSKTMMKDLSGKEWFKKMLVYIDSNQLMADAIFAAVVTCGLRPFMIMAIPSKEEDENKNKYAAAHSISSGILGVVFAALFAKPVAVAIEKNLKKDAGKYLKKNTEYVRGIVKTITEKPGQVIPDINQQIKVWKKANKGNNIIEEVENGVKKYLFTEANAFKTITQQIPQLFIMPMRAMVTIALVPIILAKAFNLTKTKKQQPNESNQSYNNLLQSQAQNTPKEFKPFIVANNQTPSFKGNQVNFSGAQNIATKTAEKAIAKTGLKTQMASLYASYLDTAGEYAAKALGKIAQTDWYKKLTLYVSKVPNNYSHIIALESFYLSGFYMYNTMSSKTIEKDQKMPLALNQGLVTVVSTIGAYTIENVIHKLFKAGETILDGANKGKMDEKQLAKVISGWSKFKTLIVFGLIYRFVAPVLITPIANRLSNEIQKTKNREKEANLQKAA